MGRAVPTDVGWTALQWPGLEHVIMSADASGQRAGSQLVLAEHGLNSVSYQLTCDHGWRVRELTISVVSATTRKTLALTADADGHWAADALPRPDLDGCIDIDIDCTPLTNTLPIRRLDWSPGAAYDLDVAYVGVPELTVRPARQRYTLLARDEDRNEALFRYESRSFRAELRVDGDGFVIDYPGLWQRVGLADGRVVPA
jgi:hypothetical protein